MDRVEWIIVAAGFALAMRVAMHFLDKNRIRQEVEANGGSVVSITWDPFGRGWFFEKNERHYSVSYRDRSGNVQSGTCKTSLFTGVYWTEPRATTKPQPRFLSRYRCSHCGYTIHREWRACPNCGKATEFA